MSPQEHSLGQVCVQVHPARAPSLDIDRLKEACEAIAKSTQGIRGIGFAEGEDEGQYVNIVFAVESATKAWPRLEAALFESPTFGTALKDSCMCMCTGADGWNDYVLLYHFDPEIPLDETGDE